MPGQPFHCRLFISWHPAEESFLCLWECAATSGSLVQEGEGKKDCQWSTGRFGSLCRPQTLFQEAEALAKSQGVWLKVLLWPQRRQKEACQILTSDRTKINSWKRNNFADAEDQQTSIANMYTWWIHIYIVYIYIYICEYWENWLVKLFKHIYG